MKKTRRKLRLWSAMLALLLTVLYTLPAFSAVIPEETVEPNTADPAIPIGLPYYRSSHSYDEGIIDGAVYYLCNAYNGQYMDVNNAVDANNTGISTYTFHGGPNQQFRIHYIGQGLYEIVPVYSQRRLHINAAHDLVIYDKNWGVEQKFRIQMLDSSTGMIFPQYGNFTRALAWDETRPNMVASKPLTTLSNQTHAQWVFERVGDTEERYAKFYIRHATGGQYIDLIEGNIAEGSLVHACPVFYGNVNQEWKFQYDEVTHNYYLMPSTRLDMALDCRGTNLGIYRSTNSGTQVFEIWKADMPEEGTNRPLFALKTSQNTYVTLGAGMSGNDNDTYRYISVTTEPTYCWILEGVPYDSKIPDHLNSVNNWLSTNVEPGYMQEQYFHFTPTVTSRYKIELKNGNVDFDSITSEDGANPEVSNRKTYNGIRVADVFCQAGTTYYITVYSKNPVDGSTTNFSIRVRQLTAVGHACDDGIQSIARGAITSAKNTLASAGVYAVTKDYMTAARVKSENEGEMNPITGYRDFNSEIFMYVGHGDPGYARYDGTKKSEYVAAGDLPDDMSNCELALWGCCYSADAPLFGDSMAEKSCENGAKTAIGWTIAIDKNHISLYISQFFNSLVQGTTILSASNIALSALESNANLNALEVAQFISSIEYYGNTNNIIFPTAQNASIATVQYATFYNNNIIDATDYTLVAENDVAGWKMYARMINGIMVDDFYIEFYDGDRLLGVHKSSYTMTNDDYLTMATQISQLISETADMQSDSCIEPSECLISYIAGEWRLIIKTATTSSECDCCVEYVYYNVLTGEVVSR